MIERQCNGKLCIYFSDKCDHFPRAQFRTHIHTHKRKYIFIDTRVSEFFESTYELTELFNRMAKKETEKEA